MSFDNQALYKFQSWVSLVVHTLMICINMHIGWASTEALYYTGHLMLFYEIFDLSIGWEGYWKKDRVMILHHLFAVWTGWILLSYLGSDNRNDVIFVKDLAKWGLLSQVTTIFNALRIVTKDWGIMISSITKIMFAVSFCVLRSLQTIGFYYIFWSKGYIAGIEIVWGICTVFTIMNFYWMIKILGMVSSVFRDCCQSKID